MLIKVCCFFLALLLICLPIRLAMAVIPEVWDTEPAERGISFRPRLRRMYLRVQIVKKKLTAGNARITQIREVRRRRRAGKAGRVNQMSITMADFNEIIMFQPGLGIGMDATRDFAVAKAILKMPLYISRDARVEPVSAGMETGLLR